MSDIPIGTENPSGSAGPSTSSAYEMPEQEAVLAPPPASAITKPLDGVIDKAREVSAEAADRIGAAPYASVIIATLAGLAMGLILGGGGRSSEVIYLRE